MKVLPTLLFLICASVPCLALFNEIKKGLDAIGSVFVPDAADEVPLTGIDIYKEVKYEVIPREVYGCMTPQQWLAEHPGGCSKDKGMQYTDVHLCWPPFEQHFDCPSCSEGKYHHKHASVKSHQLAGDGRQICLTCPKWTRYESKWRGDTSFNPCNQECSERYDSTDCENRVVSMEGMCELCDAGYTKFAVPMEHVEHSEAFLTLLNTNQYKLPGLFDDSSGSDSVRFNFGKVLIL